MHYLWRLYLFKSIPSASFALEKTFLLHVLLIYCHPFFRPSISFAGLYKTPYHMPYLFTGTPFAVLAYSKAFLSQALLCIKHSLLGSCLFKSIPFGGLTLYKASLSYALSYAYSLASLSQDYLIKKHFSCMPWFGQSIRFIGPDYTLASLSQASLIQWHHYRRPCFVKRILSGGLPYLKESLS